VRQQFDAIY